MLFQVPPLRAGFLLLKINCGPTLSTQNQLSTSTTSAGCCTTHLDFTLPSPTRPPLRIGVPGSSPVPYSPFPRTHLTNLAEVKGFIRGLGSLAIWRSYCGVRQLSQIIIVDNLNIYIFIIFNYNTKKRGVFYLLCLFIGET